MGDEKDKGQKYTKTPAAQMSRLFGLKNVELEYMDPKDVEVGTPDPDRPLGNPAPNTMLVHKTLTNRWVYVFQSLGDKVTWFAELWFDEKGFIHPVDMKAAKGKERNKRPAPRKEADKQGGRLMLPHTINGKRAYYVFYVGGTRLALESIQKLETPENFKKLFKPNGIDLKDDKSFRYEAPKEDKNSPPKVGTAGDNAYILVFDPLRYGMSANRILQTMRDREVAWVIPAKNLDAKQRERTEQRQKKRLLAATVKALLDGDRKNNLGIKKKIKTDELDKWLRDYEQKTHKKKTDVSVLAGHITGFLMEHWHMAFAIESTLLLEKADPDGGAEDLAQFMQEYAACIDRLIETEPGVNWLTKIVGDKSHFIHNYVMDTSNAPRLYAQAFGRAPRAFYGIFKEVFIPYRAKYGLTFRKTMLNPVYGTIIGREISVDLEGFRWTNKTGHIVTVTKNADIRIFYEDGPGGRPGRVVVGSPDVDPHARTVQPGASQGDSHATGASSADQARDAEGARDAANVRRISRIEVTNQTVTSTHTPTNWSKNISEADVARIQKALQEFTQVLAVLNMGLAMFDLGDHGFDTWRVLNAAAALGHTIVAFEVLTNLPAQSLRRIAFVTAIFDVVNSVHNALHAYDRGDKVGAAGFTITALGSGMVVAGIGMTMVGIETAWTGIGLVVALIGALIALFGGSHDSEIQLFAKHCIWGNSYGEDGGDDDWQEGRFENWHESKPGGLDRQIKALFNILQSFSIQGMAWKVRIQLGMHDSKSKLQVKFENNYLGESHSVEVVVDLARNRTRVVDPRDPGRLDTGGASVVYGDDYVEMTWYFGGYHHNSIGQDDPQFEGDREMDCWMRLDLKGDGKQMVPPSGKWVHYHTVARAERKASRSLDY